MKKLALIGTVALAVVGTVVFEKGVFTLPTSASPAIVFKDIPSDYWAKDTIQTAVDSGYVVGKSEGFFDPESLVTRAEFIKMIVSAEKLPVSGQTAGKDWYGPYVNAAVQNGIHAWSDFTSGDWNTPLTRAELARLAVRGTGTDNTDDKKWQYLAAKAGLIQGLDDTGRLGENETTTRAQSVTIIERILAVKRGETLSVDKHAVNRAEVVWHKTNIFTVMPKYFANVHPSSKWDPDNLFLETPDGNYRGELDALIAIDLQDANDPHRSEIPDLSELKWDNSRRGFPITDGMEAYILYYKTRVIYNKDTSVYASWNYVPISFQGDVTPDLEAYKNGSLVRSSGVYKNKIGDYPAYIIPKKLKVGHKSLMLDIDSPSIVPNKVYRKEILWSKTPEWIE